MKCSISFVVICALVATALADAQSHIPGRRAAVSYAPGSAKKGHEVKAAHPHKAQHVADARKEHNPPKAVPIENEPVEDLKAAARATVETLTPLARQGAQLLVDTAKSALGLQNARSVGNLQKRAVRLASESVDAVRVLAPVFGRVAADAAPSLIETARSIIEKVIQQ